MKIFRNVNIYANTGESARLMESLRLSNGWKRDSEKENNTKADGEREIYCFSCSTNEDRRAAYITLVRKSPEVLHVGNILPYDSLYREITLPQYNFILEEFYSKFLEPAGNELGIKTTISNATESVEDWIPPTLLKKLRTFLSVSNSFASYSHSSDQQLWFDFLLTAHREKVKGQLDYSNFKQWLLEDEKLPEYAVDDLVHEYSFGMELLDYSARVALNES